MVLFISFLFCYVILNGRFDASPSGLDSDISRERERESHGRLAAPLSIAVGAPIYKLSIGTNSDSS